MGRIRAVVFDLDDTLYPERAYAFSGFAAVAAAFEDRLGDRSESVAAMQRLLDTEHRPRVFNALLAQRGLREELHLVNRMIQVFREHRPSISLHADADAALTRLTGRHKLGMITDGPAASQWAKIDALGVRDRFDEIIVTADLGPEYAKPNRAAFELIAQRLGVEAACCAYVADNPAKDFIAPNALGWRAVGVRRPDGIYRDTPVADGGSPSRVIDSLDALPALLSA